MDGNLKVVSTDGLSVGLVCNSVVIFLSVSSLTLMSRNAVPDLELYLVGWFRGFPLHSYPSYLYVLGNYFVYAYVIITVWILCSPYYASESPT